MSNLRILDQRAWTKSGPIKDRVKTELSQKGYSHIFNDADYAHYRRLHKNQMRRNGVKGGANVSHVAWEIAQMWIEDNPQQVCDFDSLEFSHPEIH